MIQLYHICWSHSSCGTPPHGLILSQQHYLGHFSLFLHVFNQVWTICNTGSETSVSWRVMTPTHAEAALARIISILRLNSEEKKASDLIDHDILITDLEKLVGLSDCVFNWFRTWSSEVVCLSVSSCFWQTWQLQQGHTEELPRSLFVPVIQTTAHPHHQTAQCQLTSSHRWHTVIHLC